jgi:hypothetical protein
MKSNSEAVSLMREEDDEELRLPRQRRSKLQWLSWGSLALVVSVALNVLILLYLAGVNRYLRPSSHGNARYGEATEFGRWSPA